MKKNLLFLLVTILFVTHGSAQEFDAVYPATEYAVKFGPRLYYGAIRPVWTGQDTFVYTTNEPGGEAWYRMVGTRKEKIAREVYEDAVKQSRQRHYDPSDESQYAVRKEIRVVSPDSALVAFVRDHNL